MLHQAGVHQQVKSAHAVLVQHDFDALIADALDAHAGDFIRQAAHRFPSGMLDVKAEHRGETHGPHEPQSIFFKALRWNTNRPQQTHFEVVLPAHVV
ncbi:MAG: hypothetical protein ACK56I_36575, partial [bacterium]